MERKHALEKAEFALKNEKLVSLFTTLSPDPVFRFDLAGTIIMTNEAGFEATRGTEIMGKVLSRFSLFLLTLTSLNYP